MSSLRRVVIADDESIIRLDLKELLEMGGFEVVGEAANGLEALELIGALEPDLALLDIKMPGLDGIEVAQQVSDTTPVVLLTAFSQRALIEDAVSAGAVAYLVKPFKASEVVEKLNWILDPVNHPSEIGRGVDDKIETRLLVNQAKQILMESLAIDEPTAFDAIQSRAMRGRMRMRDVALRIVNEGIYE